MCANIIVNEFYIKFLIKFIFFIAWCPAERLLVPLRNYNPVLMETKQSAVWLKNTIEFMEFKIIFDNHFDYDMKYLIRCKYNRKKDRSCPVFIMEDIVKYTDNNNFDYHTLAKFGAVIYFNIVWKCQKPYFAQFNAKRDCSIEYSWYRIDHISPSRPEGVETIDKVFYYSDDKRKTFESVRN